MTKKSGLYNSFEGFPSPEERLKELVKLYNEQENEELTEELQKNLEYWEKGINVLIQYLGVEKPELKVYDFNLCPNCKSILEDKWSGVKCTNCNYWFCY